MNDSAAGSSPEEAPPETSQEFGSGWISGTLSVALALGGLAAVLCFHFPSLLTLPQAREYYPLPWVRALLHVILVAGFLFGLTSIMLRENKTLGLIGMGLVLIAALLGGSRVEIPGELKDDYYLGLDYVLLNLILFSVVFIPLEKLFPKYDQGVFRNGWDLDWFYFFIITMMVQITTYLTLTPAFVLFGWAVNPSVQAAVRSQGTSCNSSRSCSWPISSSTGCIASFTKSPGSGSSTRFIIRPKRWTGCRATASISSTWQSRGA